MRLLGWADWRRGRHGDPLSVTRLLCQSRLRLARLGSFSTSPESTAPAVCAETAQCFTEPEGRKRGRSGWNTHEIQGVSPSGLPLSGPSLLFSHQRGRMLQEFTLGAMLCRGRKDSKGQKRTGKKTDPLRTRKFKHRERQPPGERIHQRDREKWIFSFFFSRHPFLPACRLPVSSCQSSCIGSKPGAEGTGPQICRRGQFGL